jgi:hypothetical protein
MKNKYEIRGEVTVIFLKSLKYGDMETLIDTEDLKRVNDYKGTWRAHYSKCTNSYYCRGTYQKGYVRENVMLARWLLHPKKKEIIDHINHNTLDNRSSTNLRKTNISGNNQNKINTNGMRGITKRKDGGKWTARISLNKKKYHLGTFDDLEQAKLVVEAARAKHMPFSIEASQNHNLNLCEFKFQNRLEKQSGVAGITWDLQQEKWKVRATINNKRTFIGRRKNLEEAKKILQEALSS